MIDRKLPTWKSVLISALVTLTASITIFALSVKNGQAGDCKQNQSDGQCGLSSFVGFFDGVIGAGVVLLGGGTYIVVVLVRKRFEAKSLHRQETTLND
jgi:hypothetical protein